MRKKNMEALSYNQPGPADRLQRQLNFWQLWALIASGIALFLALLMATTGPAFWAAAIRDFIRQLF